MFAGLLVVQDRSGPDRAVGPPVAPTTATPAAVPVRPGPIVTGGALTAGWASEGWSWDSLVRTDSAGPGGVRAVAVTYQDPWGGFALRRDTAPRPAADAVLRVRVHLAGPPGRIGLQVQSADEGGTGPVVRRDVPSGRWVTLSVPVTQLRPPAGVRRVSVIAQNLPPGTTVWVSDVALG